MTSPEPKLTRLNKFISDTGYCSRREADKLIDQQRITINGKVPEMGTKVAEGDEVLVDGKPLKEKQDRIYIAFNKPVGITCTTERHVEGNIVDYINHEQRIFPIGRLDKPSDGLIFLTSDGDIVNKILRAGNAHEKEYVVRVDKPITDEFLTKMAAGVPILDTITLPCKIEQESRFVFRITLTQGLNRQIRRMCEYLDYEVFKLKRVRIMNIDLGKLASGEWRYLTEDEMNQINNMIGSSSKTEEASRKVQEIDGKVRVIKKASSGRNHHSNNTFNEKRREKAKEERFGNSAPKRRNDRKEQGKPQSEIKVWRPK
ncbi:23S rRNA pseudouridine(2604) synthase RluF [Aliivibrio sp. S3MY1]|uniref:23S rRNA pseudouridine(2604) synthase RluF n=1 Tax=unclassified Aliivibrio TaxID=2645654 RepID=UPI002378F871|nr:MULTISPECIES: 23S rRNA pseudouridine(2604) synthase RluF [unclassified Aliivibrio]MDD9196335.1 23S rRNA pseudouridine(2604) synthase RluF [Aliivibrio sp. S3MY1]MDD9200103.1 23S rRNA pseudouridine(2604) synthase RluF [Aliivibrio sp. S2MY1]